MGIFGKDKDDGKEEVEDEETYEWDYECDNCGTEVTFNIPFGTRIIDYENTDKCENCGCSIVDEEARDHEGPTREDKKNG